MNESVKRAIHAVLMTLDQITVSGRGNLDAMLASMMTLEQILKEDEQDAVLDGSGDSGER